MITLSAVSFDNPSRFSVFRDGSYIGMISFIGASWWGFKKGSADAKLASKQFAIDWVAE